MGKSKIKRPYKVNINDVRSVGGPYGGKKDVNSVVLRPLIEIEGLGDMGAAILEPGMTTCTFSGEEEDDGKSDHYYGPFHEFYYIICGEFTLYWGKGESKVRKGTSEKIVLKPGDALHLTPGWKYRCQNTGVAPGMFLYGMARAPGFEQVKQRGFEESTIYYLYPHLKR
ncbi:MAG: cupin domain-containing protein [Candidatus Bathyarchaeota archaeon]|nr:cupin domain-containing protein [Candidatus Bathyarchaeota archaeon]MDH5746141.1 cupin domain-containing protein [Candidatus Bathyarchaeota archaeon]